jgi:hypothetical protein
MTYFQDMTVCTYFDRSDYSHWACRLMAIGWLESCNEFSRGPADSRLLERLSALRIEFGKAFPGITLRGLHRCSLCATKETLLESHINLFIPTIGFVYAAPGRIDHYIAAHGYALPEDFARAAAECPSPTSTEYREAMSAANRHYDAPIFRGLV